MRLLASVLLVSSGLSAQEEVNPQKPIAPAAIRNVRLVEPLAPVLPEAARPVPTVSVPLCGTFPSGPLMVIGGSSMKLVFEINGKTIELAVPPPSAAPPQ